MTEPASAGALLRAARERQGLHIAALAAAIKVTPRKLDALENDRWGELPDATFTRALAQTVCRSLKIDARPVLDLLPPAGAVALEPAAGVLNAPFRERPGRDDPGLGGLAIKPMVWAATLLLVAAVSIYFIPDGLNLSRLRAPSAQAPASAAAVGQAAVGDAPTAETATATATSASADVPMAPVDVAAVPLPDAAPSAAAGALPAPVAPVAPVVLAAMVPAAPATAASAPSPGLVQVQAREASWVQVRDARGLLLLSRTVLPGERVGLDGRLPMQLTIGNAAATQVGFRGQAVDLAPRTRDNVARLELQ